MDNYFGDPIAVLNRQTVSTRIFDLRLAMLFQIIGGHFGTQTHIKAKMIVFILYINLYRTQKYGTISVKNTQVLSAEFVISSMHQPPAYISTQGFKLHIISVLILQH